jgi:hypothetical protein
VTIEADRIVIQRTGEENSNGDDPDEAPAEPSSLDPDDFDA